MSDAGEYALTKDSLSKTVVPVPLWLAMNDMVGPCWPPGGEA